MLKDLVRGRLLAAADEIFGLFQSTIASYEEQLLRAREESERQRRQLEAFSKTRLVSHVPDAPGPMGHQAQQVPPQLQGAPAGSEHTQLLQVKVEEGATAVPTQGEEAPREWQHVMTETKRRRGAAPQGDRPLAPLSDSDDVEELLRSGTDSEEELEGSSSLVHVQRGRIKQEEEEEEEESSISEMLLSGAPAKSEDDDKSPDWSPLEHQSPTPRGRSHASARAGEKPLSRSRRIHLVARMRKRGGAGSEAAQRVTRAPGKPLVRPLCGKISSRQQNVGDDMRAQPEDSFPRSVCQKHFAHKATLEGHMRAHALEPAFTCSFCGKTFSREASLAAHAQIHAGGKAFACALCGRRFCVQANMAAHVKTHRGEKLLS
ncbi:zinc finger and BTB domain-containing protein 49-like [Hippocampus zosterae]|uniref:zinc finger and BTB domain-containing protein 49-like n=1 Tax=Hippocampus zosterae TaxID=109293 RepID=UPI00223CEDFD|nr:zinc finger and BTB domain-containing protein 49-like [Hippocampus zosterae]